MMSCVTFSMESAGLYLHIPFCRRKCVYCDFYSLENREDERDRFVNALIGEIRTCVWPGPYHFDTVFFGGGTPSLLEPGQLESILRALADRWTITEEAELTLEANPGEISLEKLKAFRGLGINRISLGIQSFHETHLAFLTRIHDSADGFQAIQWAQTAGFDNINGDLIFHLPGQTLADWERDLRRLLSLGLTHISAYSLTVEPGTPLWTKVQHGRVTLPPDELSVAMMDRTREILNEGGMTAYEISNYARDGFACRHNLHYWRMEPYLGLGPSAHSYDGERRRRNVRNLDSYFKTVTQEASPIEQVEILSERDRINERLGFGIRLSEGADLSFIPENDKRKVDRQIERVMEKWPDCLIRTPERLQLTVYGRRFADAIAVDLFLD
ncbi:MAG: radical SAM family heme chaperone HemW [Fidelibacterota bacterium]